MKVCPACGTSYDDDLSYCLQDGTKLPDQPVFEAANRPTAILRTETNENNDISTAETIVSEANKIAAQPRAFQMSAVEPSTRMGCALTIGQVAVGLLVVVGLGVAGIFFTSRVNDVALAPTPLNKPTNSASNSVANAANISMNTSSTPQTSATVAKLRTISGGVLNTQAIELPEPIYPPAARAAGASGRVSVRVMIDENGRVVSATAVSGHPLLRNAAERAARSASFSPTLRGGESVKVSGVINYNFVL